MNVRELGRDLGSRLPDSDRVLEVVGLARRPSNAFAQPSAIAAFGLGLLVGVGLALLFQVTADLEGDDAAEELLAQ